MDRKVPLMRIIVPAGALTNEHTVVLCRRTSVPPARKRDIVVHLYQRKLGPLFVLCWRNVSLLTVHVSEQLLRFHLDILLDEMSILLSRVQLLGI